MKCARKLRCNTSKQSVYQNANISIHQHKVYINTFTKWRCLMLDSPELVESKISSCWKTKILNYICIPKMVNNFTLITA